MNNNPFKGKSIFDLGLEVDKEEKEETALEEETAFEEVETTLETEEYIEDNLQEEEYTYEDVEESFVSEENIQLDEELEAAEEETEEEIEEPQTELTEEEAALEEESIIEQEEKEQEEKKPEKPKEEKKEKQKAPKEKKQKQVKEEKVIEEPIEEKEVEFVLITGAYGGLGRVVMEECLNKGYAVFALDKNIDVHYIRDSVMPVQCDISNEKSLYEAYHLISDYTDKLKAIFNCAGVFYFDTIVEGSEDKLRSIFEINFFGTYRVNKLFTPFLSKGDKIINITSELAEYSPQPFMGCYSISKKMLDSYSDVLRRELNYVGIKVIKIQCGSFRTGLLDKANTEYEIMYNNTEVYKKQLSKLKFMMDRELNKQHNPRDLGKVIRKILNKKNPKICYRIYRSKSLRFMNSLSEKMQDRIYKKVIK